MRRAVKIIASVILSLAGVLIALALALHYWFFGGTYQAVSSPSLQVGQDREVDENDRLWKDCIGTLERAMATLNGKDQVRGRFYKQESVGGALGPVTELETKQRRQPLSMYLRWVKPYQDREVIFQEGLRDGRMICHEGGALLNVLPNALLKPDGRLAASFSNHPLPDLCIWRLNEQALEQVRQAHAGGKATVARQSVQVRDRPGVLYEIVFAPEHQEALGRERLVITIDKELALPLRWEQYLPPAKGAPGEKRLLEYIEFEIPDFNPGLTDADFDPANPVYKFNLSRVMKPEA